MATAENDWVEPSGKKSKKGAKGDNAGGETAQVKVKNGKKGESASTSPTVTSSATAATVTSSAPSSATVTTASSPAATVATSASSSAAAKEDGAKASKKVAADAVSTQKATPKTAQSAPVFAAADEAEVVGVTEGYLGFSDDALHVIIDTDVIEDAAGLFSRANKVQRDVVIVLRGAVPRSTVTALFSVAGAYDGAIKSIFFGEGSEILEGEMEEYDDQLVNPPLAYHPATAAATAVPASITAEEYGAMAKLLSSGDLPAADKQSVFRALAGRCMPGQAVDASKDGLAESLAALGGLVSGKLGKAEATMAVAASTPVKSSSSSFSTAMINEE